MQCKVRVIVSVCVPSGWCNSDSRAGPRTPGQSSRISTRHQRRGFARAGRWRDDAPGSFRSLKCGARIWLCLFTKNKYSKKDVPAFRHHQRLIHLSPKTPSSIRPYAPLWPCFTSTPVAFVPRALRLCPQVAVLDSPHHALSTLVASMSTE